MLGPGWSSLRLALLLLTTLTACTLPRRAQARAPEAAPRAVRYTVALPERHRQYVHVTMEVPAPRGRRATVALPAWTPGSYRVRDYARHLYDLRAEDRRGRALAVTKLDKQSWRVEHGGRPFRVRYRIFAAEHGPRSSHLDDRHASLVGASVFLYVEDELGRPCRVDVTLPAGWTAHSALTREPGAPAGTARFSAPDYDALADGPLELGTPQVGRFTVDGSRFEYVLTGAEDTGIELDRLVDDARRVVEAQGRMMGGFPMPRYVFLARVNDTTGGGLEHAASTSMMLRRRAFDDEEGYRGAARLAAHEFFHLWNVKRIHDRVLGPFDYARENHTRLLWFHEGFTETIEAQSLVRAGLVAPEDYLRRLARRFTQYLTRPGRDYEPIASLSFDAWTKAYQPADNHPNVAISYYEKGDFLGIALDLELRLRSARHDQEGSLVGLFRRLMSSHGTAGRGITLADIVAAAEAEAGEPMGWFFTRFVEGTEPLELPALLAQIGVEVRPEASWLDAQGRLRATLTRAQRWDRLDTGLVLHQDGRVRNVEPRSAADAAGLMRGDELLAVDGARADSRRRAEARLTDHEPGQTVRISLYRDGRLLERRLTLRESRRRTYRFTLAEDVDPQTRRLRDAWLEVYARPGEG